MPRASVITEAERREVVGLMVATGGGSADVDQPDFVDRAARAVENEIACAIEDKNVSCGVDSNHSGIAKKADE